MKKRKISYKPLTDEEKKNISKSLQENPPTMKDYIALFFSLMITLLPRILLILGSIVAIVWFFFMRN